MLNEEYIEIKEELRKISCSLYKKYNEKCYAVITDDLKKKLVEELYKENKNFFSKYKLAKDCMLIKANGKNSCMDLSQVSLTPEMQHYIFESMSEEVKKNLESKVEIIRSRKAGIPFLFPAAKDLVERENEIIMRQRFELRRLYEKLDK